MLKARYRFRLQLLIASLGIILSAGVCAAGEKPMLSEVKDKESYSVGYSFGKMTKNQGIEYDLELLLNGIRDAYGDKDPRLSQEEMKNILKELEKKIYVSMQKQYQEQAARNLKENDVFLAENSNKEGVITLPSGLQYKIIKEGTGPSPGKNDTVTVNYRGTLINGTEFDSSSSRGKPETLSMQAIIPGWSEALKMMKTGSTWQLFVPPALGYGQRGMERRIPPNSVLIFDMELLSIEKETVTGTAETSGKPQNVKKKSK